MALLTELRNYTNKPGKTFDGAKTDTLFAEDMNAIREAIQEGTKGIKTEFLDTPVLIGSNKDVNLERDSANALALRRTTNPQTFNIYNTFTDGSNYERGFVRWNGNFFEIGSENLGSGSARILNLLAANGNIWFNRGGPSAATQLFIPRTLPASSRAILGFTTGTSLKAQIGLDSDSTDNLHIGNNIFGTKWLTIDTSTGNVGINNSSPNTNAILDLQSTTKAVLFPRMTTTQRDAISSPVEAMTIYSLTNSRLEYYNGTSWGAV